MDRSRHPYLVPELNWDVTNVLTVNDAIILV